MRWLLYLAGGVGGYALVRHVQAVRLANAQASAGGAPLDQGDSGDIGGYDSGQQFTNATPTTSTLVPDPPPPPSAPTPLDSLSASHAMSGDMGNRVVRTTGGGVVTMAHPMLANRGAGIDMGGGRAKYGPTSAVLNSPRIMPAVISQINRTQRQARGLFGLLGFGALPAQHDDGVLDHHQLVTESDIVASNSIGAFGDR
jgi:hypothetical protein